jgi:hypothetical protein
MMPVNGSFTLIPGGIIPHLLKRAIDDPQQE